MLRLYNDMSLDEIAAKVGKTRQYLHKLETGQTQPTAELIHELSDLLHVMPEIFTHMKPVLQEEQIHFRSKRTSRQLAKKVVVSRGDYITRLVGYIDTKLKLPVYAMPSFGNSESLDVNDIERIAEDCRNQWGLGLGPISSMSRLCENLGIVVTSFPSISKEVDALSLATKRPVIVRNEAKESACRQRFDIGHELGHLVLHDAVVTGDHFTESQANRFSGAFLIPRAMMKTHLPSLFRGRFNWTEMGEFKKTWKVSKAAILYRARQLDLLSQEQYLSGVIYLKRTGEATTEKEDYLIAKEEPELLMNCFKALAKKGIYAEDISSALSVTPEFLEELTNLAIPRKPTSSDDRIRAPSLRIVE